MKIKLNYQGLETLFAELAPPEKKAIHLLVTGSDKGNKITKLTTELVSIIAFLCRKLNWTEDTEDEDENLISGVVKESKEGVVTYRTLTDYVEDQEYENYTSSTPDIGIYSDPFDILQDENSSMTKAAGEDKMKESCLEPDIEIEEKSDSDAAGLEKMELIHIEEAEQSVVEPLTNLALPLSCSHCHKKFQKRSKLKRHEMVHNKRAEKRQTNIGNGNSFSCLQCDKDLSSARLLRVHERIHTGDLFSCNQCDKKFTRAEHLKRHEKMHI